MTQINAYLNFGGKCRDAMTFYKECLGGELTLQTVGSSPVAGQMPAGMQEQVMHSSLVKNGMIIMATDMTREKLVDGNTVYLCVNCCTSEEINTYFNKLSVGGEIIDPLAEMFWGGIFGTMTDKFGIRWMFIYDKNDKQ
jgi:PhnB protein